MTRSARVAIAVLTLLTAAGRPACAKKQPLSELVAQAQKIYLVPLAEAPYEAVLTIDDRKLGDPMTVDSKKEYRAVLASKEAIAAFNKELLEKLNAWFGGKVSLVPPQFAKKEKVFLVEYDSYDFKALDCELYVVAEMETGGRKREASYSLSGPDLAKEKASARPDGPDITLKLFHKRKPDEKGKKLLDADNRLIGYHSIEVDGALDIGGAVADKIAGKSVQPKARSRVIDSDYFSWTSARHAQDTSAVQADFDALAQALQERFPRRIADVLPKFEKELKDAGL